MLSRGRLQSHPRDDLFPRRATEGGHDADLGLSSNRGQKGLDSGGDGRSVFTVLGHSGSQADCGFSQTQLLFVFESGDDGSVRNRPGIVRGDVVDQRHQSLPVVARPELQPGSPGRPELTSPDRARTPPPRRSSSIRN